MSIKPTDSLQVNMGRYSWPLFFPWMTLSLVILSGLDVWLTYCLLGTEGGRFIESNPVAQYFIYGWGLKGMLYFKGAMTLLACVIAQFVARTKPVIARRLLLLTSCIVGLVVIYSVLLLAGFVGH